MPEDRSDHTHCCVKLESYMTVAHFVFTLMKQCNYLMVNLCLGCTCFWFRFQWGEGVLPCLGIASPHGERLLLPQQASTTADRSEANLAHET